MIDVPMASRALDTYIRTILSDGRLFALRALSLAESACENLGAISLFFCGLSVRVDAIARLPPGRRCAAASDPRTYACGHQEIICRGCHAAHRARRHSAHLRHRNQCSLNGIGG